MAARADLPASPGGDLVQAGPLLVRDGRSLMDGDDREGFSAGSAQFDSDITAERHPRCALGVSDDELLAVCCDGRRTGVDAGLDLAELARLMLSFGAREAINLDGGGSATLVHRGHLLNRPYSNVDQPAPESRPVVTALLFGAEARQVVVAVLERRPELEAEPAVERDRLRRRAEHDVLGRAGQGTGEQRAADALAPVVGERRRGRARRRCRRG